MTMISQALAAQHPEMFYDTLAYYLAKFRVSVSRTLVDLICVALFALFFTTIHTNTTRKILYVKLKAEEPC
jgi:hypothetical protein